MAEESGIIGYTLPSISLKAHSSVGQQAELLVTRPEASAKVLVKHMLLRFKAVASCDTGLQVPGLHGRALGY